jgi:hypothetical protein
MGVSYKIPIFVKIKANTIDYREKLFRIIATSQEGINR